MIMQNLGMTAHTQRGRASSGTSAVAAEIHQALQGSTVKPRELANGQRAQLWIANVETEVASRGLVLQGARAPHLDA